MLKQTLSLTFSELREILEKEFKIKLEPRPQDINWISGKINWHTSDDEPPKEAA